MLSKYNHIQDCPTLFLDLSNEAIKQSIQHASQSAEIEFDMTGGCEHMQIAMWLQELLELRIAAQTRNDV